MSRMRDPRETILDRCRALLTTIDLELIDKEPNENLITQCKEQIIKILKEEF